MNFSSPAAASRWLALLALLGNLAWAAPTPPSAAPRSPAATHPASASGLDAALFYQLLLAEISAQTDDAPLAFSLLLDGARKLGDERLYRRATQVALRARAGDSALQAARAWAASDPQSAEAARNVLHILLALNRVAETPEPLRAHLRLASDRAQALWDLPALYARASDHALAAQILQRALQPELNDPQLGATAWAAMARVHQQAGQPERALQAIDAALQCDPASMRAGSVALALLAAGQNPAQTRVEQVAALAPVEFHLAYVKVLVDAQRAQDALQQVQQLIERHPDSADAWLLRGALSAQIQAQAPAQAHLQHYLELSQAQLARTDLPAAQAEHLQRGRSQAHLLLAQLASAQGDDVQAERWLSAVVHPQDRLRALIRRAELIAKRGALDDALALLANAPDSGADDAQRLYVAQLSLLRQHKNWSRALDLVQDALAHDPDDPDHLYDQALLQERLGALSDMERSLRRVIALRPDDAHAYNALGYSLAERNLRLDEALTLVEKAVSLAPQDAYIRDSLAWVRFRLGQGEQALTLLQQAMQAQPDAEIAAHLGEVLWSLQRREQALQAWRQGHSLAPDNDTLQQTLKRLGVRL